MILKLKLCFGMSMSEEAANSTINKEPGIKTIENSAKAAFQRKPNQKEHLPRRNMSPSFRRNFEPRASARRNFEPRASARRNRNEEDRMRDIFNAVKKKPQPRQDDANIFNVLRKQETFMGMISQTIHDLTTEVVVNCFCLFPFFFFL